jgi:IS1 family transposase
MNADTEARIIRFQASERDEQRIQRLRLMTEARSMSEVIRDALRHYEMALSQKDAIAT